MRTLSAAVLVSAAVLAGGCANAATSSPAGGPAAGAPASASPGCPASIAITAADASKTICVAVGGTVTINLGSNSAPWSPINISGNSLQITGTPTAPAHGPQSAAFLAKTPGAAQITSFHPACPSTPGRASCHAIVQWKVTIQVK